MIHASAGFAGRAVEWKNRRCLATAALTPLYRFCFYRVGGARHLCEEVVQETLVRAICELDLYQPGRADANIFPWLTGLP